MKTLIALALALSFATPLAAQPISTPSIEKVQYRDWRDNRDWDRRGWRSERWQQRRYWRMRQARRDCFRYGDCERYDRWQSRRDWRGRNYRRNGFTLQFGF